LPRWAVELLCRWSRSSLGYLQLAEERNYAAELVGLLSLPHSPGYYGAEERARLLHDLIDDRKGLTHRSAAQEPPPRLRSAGTH